MATCPQCFDELVVVRDPDGPFDLTVHERTGAIECGD